MCVDDAKMKTSREIKKAEIKNAIYNKKKWYK